MPKRAGHSKPLQRKNVAVSVTDAIRQPRNVCRTHGKKSENRIVLKNGRTTKTLGPAVSYSRLQLAQKADMKGKSVRFMEKEAEMSIVSMWQVKESSLRERPGTCGRRRRDA